MKQWMKALGAFDRDLHKSVNEINKGPGLVEKIIHDPLPVFEPKPMKSNRTGLGGAIATLREEMESAKQDAIAASSEVQNAVADVKKVSQEIRGVAKDMRDEAADARAALGQLTNGGPALD